MWKVVRHKLREVEGGIEMRQIRDEVVAFHIFVEHRVRHAELLPDLEGEREVHGGVPRLQLGEVNFVRVKLVYQRAKCQPYGRLVAVIYFFGFIRIFFWLLNIPNFDRSISIAYNIFLFLETQRITARKKVIMETVLKLLSSTTFGSYEMF
jgi:hypothetical protein